MTQAIEKAKHTPELLDAAKAVVAQWDSPNWKLNQPTGELINDLRAAIAKAEGHKDAMARISGEYEWLRPAPAETTSTARDDDMDAVECALKALRDGGVDVASPRDGDLDDLEQERFNAFTDACRVYEAVRSAPSPLAEALEVEWHPGHEIPSVASGNEKYLIVAILRVRSGKTFSFPALYLNRKPLIYDECVCGDTCTDGHSEDGCPTTGWYSVAGDDDEATKYSPLYMAKGDELVAWTDVPQFDAARSFLAKHGVKDV